MGAGISADLSKQADLTQSVPRSATETLEIVHQMLPAIQGARLTPVLIFDDTDRWLGGHPDRDAQVHAFFGRVLPALAGLPCALVVAVHLPYLADDALRHEIERTLETPIRVPAMTRRGQR